jgi:hypothetical protein
MSRHLSGRDVDRVLGILDGWKGAVISWELLCKECRRSLGTMPARQTLYRAKRVYDAFRECKSRIKDRRQSFGATTNLTAAVQRIERLTIELDRIQRENTQLREQFVTWQYNASVHGMSERDLNRPLPRRSR